MASGATSAPWRPLPDPASGRIRLRGDGDRNWEVNLGWNDVIKSAMIHARQLLSGGNRKEPEVSGSGKWGWGGRDV